MRNPRRITAVGFDFDHTLGIDNKLERVAFLHLLETARNNGGRCHGTLAQEIERIDALLADQRAGKFTIEAAVEAFMRVRGAPAGDWIAQYKRMCVAMVDRFVIPQPDVREMLEVLRERGVRTAILTNGWSPLQQHKARRVGFDGPVLVSADIGAQKPEPRSFTALCAALSSAPENTAYVGDSAAVDVAGALAAGMFAVWLDAEGAAYPSNLAAPSAVVHSLAELLSYV